MADGYRIAVQIDRLTKSIVPLLNAIQIPCMEQLGDCIDVGCKLLEGSFLSKPKVVKERKFNANEVGLMQLGRGRMCRLIAKGMKYPCYRLRGWGLGSATGGL